MSHARSGGKQPADRELTLREVAAMAEVEPLTIAGWVRKGLVPAPVFRGRATRYGATQIAYVRAVRMLRARNMGLDAIKKHLAGLTLEQVRRLVEPAKIEVPADDFQPSYKAGRWERVVLAPGLELWVDREGGPLLRRVAQSIWERYALER